jgi:argininosuccinate lyase
MKKIIEKVENEIRTTKSRNREVHVQVRLLQERIANLNDRTGVLNRLLDELKKPFKPLDKPE